MCWNGHVLGGIVRLDKNANHLFPENFDNVLSRWMQIHSFGISLAKLQV